MSSILFPPDDAFDEERRPRPDVGVDAPDVFADEPDADHLDADEDEQHREQREHAELPPHVPVRHDEPPYDDVQAQEKPRRAGQQPEIGQDAQRERGHAGQ